MYPPHAPFSRYPGDARYQAVFRQGPVHRPEVSSDFVAIRRQFDFSLR